MCTVVNLPPTLSKSQVSSVRKNLKMQMLTLLKLPDAVEFQYNITTLLTDLGATQSEVICHLLVTVDFFVPDKCCISSLVNLLQSFNLDARIALQISL